MIHLVLLIAVDCISQCCAKKNTAWCELVSSGTRLLALTCVGTVLGKAVHLSKSEQALRN